MSSIFYIRISKKQKFINIDREKDNEKKDILIDEKDTSKDLQVITIKEPETLVHEQEKETTKVQVIVEKDTIKQPETHIENKNEKIEQKEDKESKKSCVIS